MLAAFIAIAMTGAQPQAKANVVIRSGARVSETDWKSIPARRSRLQRELMKVEDGRKVRLRIIEFE